MNITFFEVKSWQQTHFKKKLKKHKLKFFPNIIENNILNQIKDTEILVVFVGSKINKEIISKLPKLKAIATMSTGFDHIDIEYCKKKKVDVFNVPFYGENTVAEHAFALLLALSRKIHTTHVRILNENFDLEGLTGHDLKGKTAGIIGGGHIGLNFAKMAKGFGMDVIVFDIHHQQFIADTVGFEYVELDYLLKKSDVISLHVPYNKHTHHLINRSKFKQMKKGTTLINTARGGVIDTNALLWALNKKIIGAAGLDVIEDEDYILKNKPVPKDKVTAITRNMKIINMENVVFSPHNAFNTKEAIIRILDTTAENIIYFLQRTPQHSVIK